MNQTPAEELALAKASPEGAYLSPAAQALYELEGAERFRVNHQRPATATLRPADCATNFEGG